jgi:dTDP-4-dehydrorhamnose reductase
MTLPILLTGKNGQVGRELHRLLARLGEVTAVDRQEMDLAKPGSISGPIREIRPRIIVNAAAYTAVDRAESEETLAHAINAEAPGVMAEEARRLGALMVHYSTDYVFDGKKGSPYVEDDPPNPQNVYGRTKLAGEIAVQQSGANHLIFRTEWVYAREGRNFLLTILRLAAEREELRIVSDQIGAPTWSREIAAGTVAVLSELFSRESGLESTAGVSGLYHLTAGGQTSWYDFARAILEEASRQSTSQRWFEAATGCRPIVTQRVVPISSDEYPTPARRPAYSVLSNARLKREFGVELPNWRAQLRAIFMPGTSS